ncbi:MAG: MBL fold metallo-hydrolase [Saprospiraceae bacterium]|nr:MBL fold metallo-hydrolase [Saprospiraceae bacterium]
MKFIFPLLFLPLVIFSQDPDKVEIIPIKVTEEVYMMKGAGGNMGLLVGEEGILLIDDQFAPLSEKIMAAIRKIDPGPLKYLINTHWHGDHTGGNENFKKAGATILAHKNVHKRLSEDQFMQAFGRQVEAKPKSYHPNITFSTEMNLYFNDEAILIFHSHVGHTDGDALIYFPKNNVIHMGDTYFQGKFPFVDLSSGGSVKSLIKSINQSLILIDDATQIIPGHGNLSNRAELLSYRDMVDDMYHRVKQSISSGLSLEEVQAANLSKEYEDDWGGGFISGEKFVKTIYDELSRKE